MKALDLEVSSKGKVSEDFYEDEISQAKVKRLLKATSFQDYDEHFTLRQQMVSEADNIDIDFDL